jgi:hypothetical protein
MISLFNGRRRTVSVAMRNLAVDTRPGHPVASGQSVPPGANGHGQCGPIPRTRHGQMIKEA